MAKRRRKKSPNKTFKGTHIIIALLFIALFGWIISNRIVRSVFDRTAPSIAVLWPENNAVVGDGVRRMYHLSVKANITDNVGVHRVDLYANGQKVSYLSAPPGNDTYTSAWYIVEVPNGPYNLEVRASDRRGNTASSFLDITLNNGPRVDYTPPSVEILSPADNSSVVKKSLVKIHWKVADAESPLGPIFTNVSGVKGGPTSTSCSAAPYQNPQEGDCSFSAYANSGDILTVETVANDFEGNVGKASIKLEVQ